VRCAYAVFILFVLLLARVSSPLGGLPRIVLRAALPAASPHLLVCRGTPRVIFLLFVWIPAAYGVWFCENMNSSGKTPTRTRSRIAWQHQVGGFWLADAAATIGTRITLGRKLRRRFLGVLLRT